MSESEKPFKQEIDYHRYWKEQYEKEHKRCQELQGELSIVKATTVTNSPEMREAASVASDHVACPKINRT